MKKRLVLSVLGSLALTPAFAMAQTRGEMGAAAGTDRQVDAEVVAEDGTVDDGWTFHAGVDFPTAYFFRGIGQENQGFIAQPHAEVGYLFYQGDQAWLQSVSAFVGTWNSLHSEHTRTDGDHESWYESDVWGGVTLGMHDKYRLSLGYIVYDSPNGAFDTRQELQTTLTYDDSQYWDNRFSLRPHATIAYEVRREADEGGDQGWYLGLGIEPTFPIVESRDFPLSLSIPVTAGFSLDGDYYESPEGGDDTFGFFDVGVVLNMPLRFIPENAGRWSASLGLHLLFLSDALEDLSDARGTGGDSTEVIGSLGFNVAF